MTDALKRLSDEGVAIWLDDLSRRRIGSGDLAELIDDKHLVGVTSNPTIFQKAISSGEGYEQQVADLAARKVTVEEAVRMITTADVRDAADVLRPVHDATGGKDGRVSIEVDPLPRPQHEGHHRRGQAAGLAGGPAQHLHQDPGDPRGPPRHHRDHREGHQRQRHADLLPGPLPGGHGRLPGRAWRRPRSLGIDLSGIHSVASFFVSRVDTEIDKRLDGIGTERGEGTARARRRSPTPASPTRPTRRCSASDRWTALERAGAHVQRPLWASTGVKNPELPGHDVRDGPGRGRHREHHAGGHAGGRRRPRRRSTGDTVHGTYEQARKDLDALGTRGRRLRRRRPGARGRGRGEVREVLA